MDNDQVLEITSCYAFPQDDDDNSERESSQSKYQMDMMRCVREVNIDHQVVGWYQSTANQLGSFLTGPWLETQFAYQDNLINAVCLVYDPQKTSDCTLGIRAYRLRESFLELFGKGDLSSLSLQRHEIDSRSMIEELPVTIHNSSLAKVLLEYLARRPYRTPGLPTNFLKEDSFMVEEQEEYETMAFVNRLRITDSSNYESALQYLSYDLDELAKDQNKYTLFLRNFSRAKALQADALRRKRLENLAKGEEKVPEQEILAQLLSNEPPRLESKLLIHEIEEYSKTLEQIIAGNIIKQFANGSVEVQSPRILFDNP
jgi:translation initiation factor 3 subunit H